MKNLMGLKGTFNCDRYLFPIINFCDLFKVTNLTSDYEFKFEPKMKEMECAVINKNLVLQNYLSEFKASV
jgi:hypothetical protein